MINAEEVKRESQYLRGALPEELANGEEKFSDASEIVLKFHGIYQQDNRDVRRERVVAKLSPEYICMVRASIPGGALTAEQYLVMDRLATEVGNDTLRITTRQGLQYHFAHKGDLKKLISTLNTHLVTTLAACGDVVRNTMCCPAPYADSVHVELHELTQEIAKRFRPRTESYYEVWVDGDKAVSVLPNSSNEPVEPLYKDVYLPRKFKIGVAFPGDNCIDAYTQDVALVPHLKDGRVEAFTVLVGGGFGVSHADDTTYPRVASPLTTVAPDQVIDVVEAIVVVQRDNGERGDRKHARMKYLIDRLGLTEFKRLVEVQYGSQLGEPRQLEWEAAHDHLGWQEQGDGKWFLGLRVESGRILDRPNLQLRSALRDVVSRYNTPLRFTPNQDVILHDINEGDRRQIEAILRKAGVALVSDLAPVVRSALACVALPTCGLALTEAERVLPEIIDDLHSTLSELDLGTEEISFRMTGCPNGCARPYSAEIGLVGRSKTSYDIMLGGDRIGSRLTKTYKKSVKRAQIVSELRPLLERFRDERDEGESFGDWAQRCVEFVA